VSQGINNSSSTRVTETDAERALRQLLPTSKEFLDKLGDLIRGRKAFKLRLEISGDGGRVTDVDLNEFTKVRPHKIPEPTQ